MPLAQIEPDRLAGRLRAARLTVVCGALGAKPAGGDIGTVLGRLRRRARDRVLALAPAAMAMTAADRRRGGGQASAELVVHVNAWTGSPVATLQESIHRVIAAAGAGAATISSPIVRSLASWCSLLDVRFLIVLDRFEEFLQLHGDTDAARRLAEEMRQILGQSQLPVNFLVSVRADALVAMQRFQAQLTIADTAPAAQGSVRRVGLPPGQAERRVSPTRPASLGAAPAPVAAPAAAPPLAASLPLPPAPRARGSSWKWPIAAAVLAGSALAAVAVLGPARLGMDIQQLPGLAVLEALLPGARAGQAASGSGASWASLADEAPTAPHPRLALAVAPGNPTDFEIALELMRRIGPSSGVDLSLVRLDPLLQGESSRRTLAIVDDDRLRALRSASGPQDAQERPSIVLPLFPEEIYFIARADAPLRYIHDIKGSRINIGAAQEARATTAGIVYERLFGQALPHSDVTELNRQEALHRLLVGDGVDVLVLIGAQPDVWLQSLQPEAAGALKFLQFDAADPADARLLQDYLPVTLHASGDNALPRQDVPSLGVMSFLVAYGKADEHSDPIEAVARALCAKLPQLRESGHPKWKEVGAQPWRDSGWPAWGAAAKTFAGCEPLPPDGNVAATAGAAVDTVARIDAPAN